jgi:hypothetical protein
MGLLLKGEVESPPSTIGPLKGSVTEGLSGQTVCYGYRSDEIEQLSRTEEQSDAVTYNLKEIDFNGERFPVGVSLGCHVQGVTLPHADPSCAQTLGDGVKVRMGRRMPHVVNRTKVLKELREDTQNLIKKLNLTPLDSETQFFTWEAFIEWLDDTNYPKWRKDELIELWHVIDNFFERDNRGNLIHFTVKLFMKDEHYVDFKQARGIYARDDVAKVVFGPMFKLIEKEVYNCEAFIKHVPVKDRPKYMYDILYAEGARYIQTDHSSFEALFDELMMDNNEFVLYRYMLQHVPAGKEMLSLMEEVLQGENCVNNKYLRAFIRARRMSGEMNTSLGNGWSNLSLMHHVVCNLERATGLTIPLRGVVEGDDGLFSFVGVAPQTLDFTKIGCSIKLVEFDKLSEAGFCGNIFDEEDLQIVTDPFKVCASFGWSTRQYLNASSNKKKLLLRCKALSMAHQYPGCPIIGKLAQYGLRVTKSMDVRGFIEKRRDLDMYQRQVLLNALSDEDIRLEVEPGIGTRLLFEELYGIRVEEQQYIEKYLDSLNVLTPLELSFMDMAPVSWRQYHETYQLQLTKAECAKGGSLVLNVPRFKRSVKGST